MYSVRGQSIVAIPYGHMYMKWIGWYVAEILHFKFFEWPQAIILDLIHPEVAHRLIRRHWKPYSRTKQEVDRMMRCTCRDRAIWNFPMCEIGCRSVGRSSIYILTLISCTSLRYIRNLACKSSNKHVAYVWFDNWSLMLIGCKLYFVDNLTCCDAVFQVTPNDHKLNYYHDWLQANHKSLGID